VLKQNGIFIIEDIDKKYYSEFMPFIGEIKNRYNFVDLIEIPNVQNGADNNVILIVK